MQDDTQSETKKHAQALDLNHLKSWNLCGDLSQAALQEAVGDCLQGHPKSPGGGDTLKTKRLPPLRTPSDAAECRLVELNVQHPARPSVLLQVRPCET